ncbi:MAG: hypothetical protein GEU73_10660 [Chloroflexi bacterium]|nr:hypothetical protein [Chloroflexota bacterium]
MLECGPGARRRAIHANEWTAHTIERALVVRHTSEARPVLVEEVLSLDDTTDLPDDLFAFRPPPVSTVVDQRG